MIVATGQITITEVYDGDSFYRAWANSSNGKIDFSTTDSDREYFGVYTGLTDPGNDYTKYKWTKIKGATSVVPIILAPQGTAIYNHDGSITLALTLFQGSEEVTPDWIRWYQINPMSPGDEYSSVGWSFLNETNKELILDEGRIHDSNTILVVAEFGGRIYRVTQQVEDITDPVDVEVIGPTVFKNGRGSVDLFAKLYKNGIEIDKRGEDYGYSWYGYDNFGNLVKGFHKFGKQVTFTRDEVDNIVNISLMASENIATEDKLTSNGTGVSKNGSQFTINPVNRTNGVRISSVLFDKGITYKLEFTLEELSGRVSGLGGSTAGFEPLKVRVNGKFYPVTYWGSGTINLSDEGLDEHFIELWLTSQGGTELLIQPGLGSVVQGTEVRLTDIGVMRGAQEPSDEHNNTWEPYKDTTWSDNRDETWLRLL